MRSIITYIISKRNPAFAWHPEMPVSVMYRLAWQQAWNLVRGMKLLVLLRNPRMMLRASGVEIACVSRFSWGRFLKLGRGVLIDAASVNGISLGNNVSIGAYSRLVASGSIMNPGVGISLGNNVGIGEYAYLGGGGGLEIGDDCIAGQYLSCHPENHITDDPNLPVRLQGVTRQGIKIGRNCWLGSKVTILDGVTIGDNCIIAAGAVVTKSFSNNSVIAGVPAKLIKTINNKDLNHEKHIYQRVCSEPV